MHLLIPFACSTDARCLQALEPLQLPHLEKVLRRLAPGQTDSGPLTSLTPPHERVLAQLLGLAANDGCIPWAAHQAALAGREAGTAAWAWITPVHWDVGADHITMADPAALDLQESQSRELLAAMQPFFDEDGMTLEYAAPHRWLAQGQIFAGLASASLDRVAGREISPWMSTAAPLRRLQNEMQMLLYTNPINDTRTARGLATVNSFWVSGTGSLPPDRPSGVPDVTVADALRVAALRQDWDHWARNWVALDQNECRSLLEAADSGRPVQLTLCGESNALRFVSPRDSALNRLRRRFTRIRLQGLQDQL